MSRSSPAFSLPLLLLLRTLPRCGWVLGALLAGCGGGGADPSAQMAGASTAVPAPAVQTAAVDSLPAAGFAGGCVVPSAAQAATVDRPDHVVGTGTPASCTSAAVVQAVAAGGVTTFNCGPDPVTITLTETAKVFNNRPDVVLDGGGTVTLSGGGTRRILYQNTCDQNQVWTSASCQLQTTPQLTLQRITLADGNSTGQSYGLGEVYGGGALYVRGGRVRIVDARFLRNQTEPTGPDLGGGAVRLFGTQSATVAGSTFGGAAGQGNQGSNGGALSTLGASLAVYNSLLSHNIALGHGANPAAAGTPGGGSGGAIYQDGNRYDLSLCGVSMHDNQAPEGGSAIFFVSNDRTGTLSITDSTLSAHPLGNFETAGLPGLFVLAAPGQPVIVNSSLQR